MTQRPVILPPELSSSAIDAALRVAGDGVAWVTGHELDAAGENVVKASAVASFLHVSIKPSPPPPLPNKNVHPCFSHF